MKIDIWKIASRWSDDGNPESSVLHLFEKYDIAFVNKESGNRISNHIKNGNIALLAIADGQTIRAIGKVEKVGVVSDFENAKDLYDYLDVLCYKIKFYKLSDEESFPFSQRQRFAHIDNEDIFSKIEDLYLQKTGVKQMNDYIELLKANKNMILTGAPGTGKTFLAKQIAESIVKENSNSQQVPLQMLKNAIISFKPDLKAREEKENLLNMFLKEFPKDRITSLSLDDYCAGKGDRNNFCWWIESGLKVLGKYHPGSARSYLIYWSKKKEEYSKHGYIKDEDDNKKALKVVLSDIHGLIEDKNSQKYEDKFGNGFLLKILSTYYPEEFFPINSIKHIENVCRLFNLKTDSISVSDKNIVINDFYKAQCKSKDITSFEFMRILYNNFNIAEGEIIYENKIVSEGDISFVQFHPSYDYTDFVEGLRPAKNEESNDIGFELRNGIFKEFCKKAMNNPHKKYVFIIDEINRGEISKVFGELFFSIDPGYRGEKGKVKTQYANMQNEDTFYSDIDEDFFYVPENVYIIGTMNDIDRSVESFDFAMRRRFVWKEIKAEETQNMLNTISDIVDVDAVKKRMNNLNTSIGIMPELGSHYKIGAAYFLKLANYNGDFSKLWELHLEPLLREYLRGMQGAEKLLGDLSKAYDSYEG